MNIYTHISSGALIQGILQLKMSNSYFWLAGGKIKGLESCRFSLLGKMFIMNNQPAYISALGAVLLNHKFIKLFFILSALWLDPNLCLYSSCPTHLPQACLWSSHSAPPQTVTPAEKININPHGHDDTGDNDADSRCHGDSSHRLTFVVSERRPYLFCKCLYQGHELINSESDRQVSYGNWMCRTTLEARRVTFDTSSVPKERHERRWMLDNKMYCPEQEWRGWVKLWIAPL